MQTNYYERPQYLADFQEHADQQLKTEQTNQTSLKEKQFPQEETSIVFPERKNPPPESDS